MSNTINSGGHIPERDQRIVPPIVKGQPVKKEQQDTPEDPQVIADRARRRKLLEAALSKRAEDANKRGGIDEMA